MQEALVIVRGHLTADPVLRHTGQNVPVANFRVGVTERVRDRESGEWRDGDSSFFNVSCWRAMAENVNESLRKGDKVVVTGRLRQRSYQTSEGVDKQSSDIEADAVGPDLSRHTASVRKPSRFTVDSPVTADQPVATGPTGPSGPGPDRGPGAGSTVAA